MNKFPVLLAISLAVFWPAFFGQYLYWDDSTHIINNPNLVAGNWWYFWTAEYYRLYIPVIYTVWTWIFMITSHTWAYHLFNLILHSLNGVMFYRLGELAFPKATARALWLATLAFMLHPLQTEPVAWIAGGRDLLAATFGFATILALWHAAKWWEYGASTLLFTLSLLSKSTTAPLPVALLFIPEFRKRMNRTRWIGLGIWLVMGIVVLYINKLVQQVESDNLLKPLSILERAATVADIFGFYVQKIFVPWPLASDYGRVPSFILKNGMYWITGAYFLASAIAIGVAKYYRREFPLWGFMIFGVLMSPVSGVFTFMAQSQSSVADRYVYLAWAGPCLLIAAAATRWKKLQPAIVVILLIWSALCFKRSEIYVDNQAFFPAMLQDNPDSCVGHTTMGVVDFSAGRMDLAEQHFKDAHAQMPLSVSPVGNLAQLYLEQQRMTDILKIVEPIYDSPGFFEFNKTNKSSVARCARVIARAHMMVGRLSEANRKFCQALFLDPEDQEARSDYANFAIDMQRRSLPVQPCAPL